jgi:hypothetical protein
MNFIQAVQHGSIGYGIRRAIWPKDVILTVNNFGGFDWMLGGEAELLGDDPASDLSVEDVKSEDWVTIRG